MSESTSTRTRRRLPAGETETSSTTSPRGVSTGSSVALISWAVLISRRLLLFSNVRSRRPEGDEQPRAHHSIGAGGWSPTAACVRRSRHGRRHPWARVTGDGRSGSSAAPSLRARAGRRRRRRARRPWPAHRRPATSAARADATASPRRGPAPPGRGRPRPRRRGRDLGPRRRRGERPRPATAHGQPGPAARAPRPADERRRPDHRHRRRGRDGAGAVDPRVDGDARTDGFRGHLVAGRARAHAAGTRRRARLARTRRLGRPDRRRREHPRAAGRAPGPSVWPRRCCWVATSRRPRPAAPGLRSSRAPSRSSMPSRWSPPRAPVTSVGPPSGRSPRWCGSRSRSRARARRRLPGGPCPTR